MSPTLLVLGGWLLAAPPQVQVTHDARGERLQVDGRDFFVVGVNWDFIPIGQNYSYSLWTQPDDVIEAALANELPLLKGLGVNAIRQYVGIPARWVRFIFERYGVFTVLNHPMGRYGATLDGVWVPSVDYSEPRLRRALKEEIVRLVEQYRDTPGILLWLLGNENNYGLSWRSAEIEALPQGEQDTARARHLYSLFGEVIAAVKAADAGHPVAIANGDVQYLDLIAELCPELDVFGTNVYRGRSARDLFQLVHDKLHVPVLFTEFGADAFDAKRYKEDELTQARVLLAQWQELYLESAGQGGVGNAVGGFVFQWSDGWWKYGLESRLDVHDPNAGWPNASYPEDFVEGENNMNEEWWGLCAKGPPDERGLFPLYPRAAYYALAKVLTLDPYASSTTADVIRARFASVDPVSSLPLSRGDRAAASLIDLTFARLSGARVAFTTFTTGGQRLTTAAANQGFDHLESVWADFQVQPTERLVANLSLNVVGNVPRNPIDELYYENHARPVQLTDTSGKSVAIQDRLRIYKASLTWDEPWFKVEGFYRAGHFHWGNEGDFFGLYREANYGANLDVYNADAPLGMEVTLHKALEGLKVAFGPQLWWGANPSVMTKYRRQLGPVDATVVYEEQVAAQSSLVTSSVVPERQNRKVTAQLGAQLGPVHLDVGLIWSGSPRLGNRFLLTSPSGGVLEDHVTVLDTLGGKAKVVVESGRWHWYAQGAYMGLVAEAGPTATTTFTGWALKDSGSGNQVNGLTGLAVTLGDFQLGPNLLYQRPLVGPGPSVNSANALRNILDDPFVVRANRELLAAELMLTYDPTPATWMWAWDNDLREDAPFAASVNGIFRHQPTSQDAAIGLLADGVTRFAFQGATPPRDLWEVRARIVAHPRGDLRLVAHGFVGLGEANGSSQRVTHRYGGDLRVAWNSLVLSGALKFNDWGPYDYHKDFNLTFPIQAMAELSYTLGRARWLWLPQTSLSLRGTYRTLNGYSPRFDATTGTGWGNEYEVRTTLTMTL